VTLVGKALDLHVDQVLETTREENLGMIRDTVRDLGAAVAKRIAQMADEASAN
jgi:isopropylmalate/homocitrate/citramalate synthase